MIEVTSLKLPYNPLLFKINIGRRNLVSKYYFWASTWRSFSNTILKGRGLMLYKVGCNFQGHSKSTSKCFSRNPVHLPICFFTTNFNRVSQLVQIRMSGDNVLWENFKRMRQRRKKSYEKVWILYGR